MQATHVRRARELRRNATLAERLLWSALRRAQLGVPIRRQHPIGPYIADFYCPAARLVIELDGPHHGIEAQIDHDEIRREALHRRGIEVTRLGNADVLHHLSDVVASIARRVRERLAQRT